ncbi:MAG: hypothetical protein AAF548_18600 [Actinomycetota bacterium]
MRRIPARVALAASALALAATACGGDGDSTTTGVASLEDAAGADAVETDAELTADEAALEFSACMREQGLDFPDIGVDAEGNIDLRDAFQSAEINPQSEDFQTGMQVCGELLADAGFGGGGGRAALADNPELQDGLVSYSDCIREQGFDVGDLQLGGPGTGAGAGGDADGGGAPPERGQGAGQAGFGDRNERFAAQLGLDPEDPAVVEALDVCAPILDEAFAGLGGGFGGPPPAD